jgi:hypothetical protein
VAILRFTSPSAAPTLGTVAERLWRVKLNPRAFWLVRLLAAFGVQRIDVRGFLIGCVVPPLCHDLKRWQRLIEQLVQQKRFFAMRAANG